MTSALHPGMFYFVQSNVNACILGTKAFMPVPNKHIIMNTWYNKLTVNTYVQMLRKCLCIVVVLWNIHVVKHSFNVKH